MEIPPHLEKTNELYDRLYKAFGEQESNLQTHELIGKLFDACMNLAAGIGTAKQYARPVPNQSPKNLEELLAGTITPGKEVADAAVETVNVLFEGAICEIERHVRNGAHET